MAQIFAYIVHTNGVADDSAAELVVAAAKIDAGEPVTAIVTGSGPTWTPLPSRSGGHLSRGVEIRQRRRTGLSQRRGVRKLLVKVLPADAIVLVPHDTFGMDLGPGLSIKLEAPSPPTSWHRQAMAVPMNWCARNTPEWRSAPT
jgi:electron transfer flavoprotein alpha subunit